MIKEKNYCYCSFWRHYNCALLESDKMRGTSKLTALPI